MPPAEDLRRARIRRIVTVVLFLLALYLLGRFTGLSQWLSVEQVRQRVESAGAWGPASFIAVFVTGVIVQIPAVPLVLASPALFDPFEAWLWCLLAGNIAVLANFALVRHLGGQALAQSESAWLRKLLASIDRHPVRTVAMVRTIAVMLPPVTSALALTGLRPRDHFVGSLIGLPLPVALLVGAGALLMR